MTVLVHVALSVYLVHQNLLPAVKCVKKCAASCNGTVSTHARAHTHTCAQANTHSHTYYITSYICFIYI